MKGYSEHRGHCSKLDFDHATRQFVSKPIVSNFAHQDEPILIAKKLTELRQNLQRKKTKQQALKTLSTVGPATRDDVGLTEFYAEACQTNF
jgi:hypothetical protein